MLQKTSSFARLFVLIGIVATSISVQAARDAGMQRGFSADGVFSTSDIDAVNSFSGNLTIPIPLGGDYASSGTLKYGFQLVYNSGIWDYVGHSSVNPRSEGYWALIQSYQSLRYWNLDDYDGPGGDPNADGAEAIPARTFNAGVGWMVSLGEMRSKSYHTNGVPQVVYIGADGQEHEFFGAIHGASNDIQTKSTDTTGANKVHFYTRDNSYIRMRVGTSAAPTDANWREIHFPDGIVQRFHCVKDCDKMIAQWVLKEVGDPYGNLLVVTRSTADHTRPAPSLSGDPNWTWTFTEYFSPTTGYKRAGDPGLVEIRKHYLRFRVTRSTSWISEVRLEELDLAAYSSAGQTRAKYKLGYRNTEIYRDVESTWWAPSSSTDPLVYPPASATDRIAVSLLDSVSLPPTEADELSGTPSGQWQMTYYGDDCDKTVPQPLLPQCDATPFFSMRLWGNDVKHRVNQVFGRLKQVKMPTGAAIGYEYSSRGYPQRDSCQSSGPNPGAGTRMFGVSRRQRYDSSGQADGKPTLYFAQSYALALGECKPSEFVTAVVEPPHVSAGAFDPEKTKTRVTLTFHSLWAEPLDATCDGNPANGCWTVREHGLPISHKKQKVVGGVLRSLSSSTYECKASLFYDSTDLFNTVRRIAPHNVLEGESPTCNQPKRSTWVRYEASPTNMCDSNNIPGCITTNRRESSSVTEYYDDKFSVNCNPYDGTSCDPVRRITDRSDFDGFGNYRRIVTDGNLLKKSDASSARSDKRTSYTRFNDGYSYEPPTSPANYPAVWILGTSTESFVTQDGESNVRRTLYDPATGFLVATRTLKSTAEVTAYNTAQTSDKDFLTTRYREIQGEDRVVTTDYFFGGDAQLLSGTGFSEPTGGWVYAVENVSRGGVVEKVSYKGKCGEITDPVLMQNDIDRASGMVKSTTDEFGAKTLYDYDLLGRLTSISPPALTEAKRIPFVYTYPRLTSGSRVVTMTRAGAEGEEWHYDGYGRLTEARKDIPSGTSKVVTTYTMTGLKASVSGTIAKNDNAGDLVTADYHYDIFGRETKIVPPGSLAANQSLLIEYQGVREVKRDREGLSVGAYDSHGKIGVRQSFDTHGRLIAVDENTGQNEVRTRYEYDPGNRLTKVRSPQGGNKDRKFRYDGRGLLIEEEHPELDGRSIKWRGYDARGNPGLRKLGYPNVDDDSSYTPFDVGYRYDCSELLTAVRQLVPNRPLKSFAYQGGKLTEASRQNYVVNAAATSQPAQIPVKTVFKLDAIGRVERKTLNAGFEVYADFKYDDLGRLIDTTYSAVSGCSSCPIGPPRTLTHAYNRNHLSSITQTAPFSLSYVSSMSYFPNGMVKERVRGNGVKDVYEIGDDVRPRPTRIQVLKTSGQAGGFDANVVYDSEGTVEAMGALRFRYDALRRVTGMKIPAGGAPGGVLSEIQQVYGYDAASNPTSLAGTSIPIDPATNRIKPERASYDAAGNVIKLHSDPRRLNYEVRFHEGPAGSEVSWYDSFNMPRRLEVHSGGSLSHGRVYIYDASDERVAVQEYGVPGEDAAPSVRERWMFRGLNHEILREFERIPGASTEWRWSKDSVYAGSHLVAGITSSGASETVQHYHSDHLGTVRLLTDASGNPADHRTYWAFGEEVLPRPDTNRKKFAGHERDDDGTLSVVGDLDYMHARYYAAALGRFLSMDPARDSGRAGSPQSWNRYAYVSNNPMTATDPDGERTRLYGEMVDNVHPGDLVTLKDRKNPKYAEHVAVIADIRLNVAVTGVVTFDAYVYENAPQLTYGDAEKGILFDLSAHSPTPVNSNSLAAGAMGGWNAVNLKLHGVIPNRTSSGAPFTPGMVQQAAGAVGPITYNNVMQGQVSTDRISDCAGYVNLLTFVLQGTVTPQTHGNPTDVRNWRHVGQWGDETDAQNPRPPLRRKD